MTPTLETRRLLLLPLELADAEQFKLSILIFFASVGDKS
jgi:hypothetical protein